MIGVSGPANRAALRCGLGAGVVLLLLTALGVWFWGRAPRGDAIPVIATAGLDPAVARLIESSLAGVQQAPRSAAAWGRLGSVLMHYEFRAEAEAALTRAERFAPRDPRWPYLNGLLQTPHDPESALENLRRAAALCAGDPDTPALRFAEFLSERGRDQEAERGFEALLTRKADHAPALLGLARLRHRQGRARECTNLLAPCLADPHTAKAAHALVATVAQGLGDTAGALAAARKSATLSLDRPWPDPYWNEAHGLRVGRKAWLEEGTRQLDRGQWAEAEVVLSRVTAEYAEDEEAWYLLGWGCNQQGRGQDAEKALREHLRRAPQSAKGHAQLAVALLGQQRPGDAVPVLQRGLELKPTWRELHSNLGYAWVQLGQEEQARDCFRRALELDPAYLPSYTALAELELRRGDRPGARRLLQQALELDPTNARVRDLGRRLEQGAGEGAGKP